MRVLLGEKVSLCMCLSLLVVGWVRVRYHEVRMRSPGRVVVDPWFLTLFLSYNTADIVTTILRLKGEEEDGELRLC